MGIRFCPFRRLFRAEAGATLTLVTVMLPLLMAVAGLVIDTGVHLFFRMQLATAVDAAAMKGAMTFREEVWLQGEIAECDLSDSPWTPACLDPFPLKLCWKIMTHVPEVDAELGAAAMEMAQRNFTSPHTTYTVLIDPAIHTPGEGRPPRSRSDKPEGKARWRVHVDGTSKAPVYFLRTIGVQAMPMGAKAAVTWQKRDKYHIDSGPCEAGTGPQGG